MLSVHAGALLFFACVFCSVACFLLPHECPSIANVHCPNTDMQRSSWFMGLQLEHAIAKFETVAALSPYKCNVMLLCYQMLYSFPDFTLQWGNIRTPRCQLAEDNEPQRCVFFSCFLQTSKETCLS